MPSVPWSRTERTMTFFGANKAMPVFLALLMGLQHAFAMCVVRARARAQARTRSFARSIDRARGPARMGARPVAPRAGATLARSGGLAADALADALLATALLAAAPLAPPPPPVQPTRISPVPHQHHHTTTPTHPHFVPPRAPKPTR